MKLFKTKYGYRETLEDAYDLIAFKTPTDDPWLFNHEGEYIGEKLEEVDTDINCPHVYVKAVTDKTFPATRFQPAEYIYHAHCLHCGVDLDPDDVSSDAEWKD